MKKYAVIVAGGEGNRAGGSVPKQFQKIGGIPMLWWSVRAFHSENPDTKIILVLHPGFFDDWDILYSELPEEDRRIPVHVSCGGRSRLESVKNGLMSIPDDDAWESLVAVHDAARPMVGRELIARGWAEAEKKMCAVPVIPETDTLRKIDDIGSFTVDRNSYVRVQTPQVFHADVLKEAYKKPWTESMTDDASVVEEAGYNVALFEGSPNNLKVTYPLDFRIAEALLIREK